jgi:hypothetical protein
MQSDSVQPNTAVGTARIHQAIAISRFVNEPPVAWGELLTAHDLARLTRRPPWLLSGMAVLGRFPRQRRFHSRRIGWLRSDVLQWLSHHPTAACQKSAPVATPRA